MATPSTQKQFPCPSCGASLEFNPQVAQLKCPYCGYEKAIPRAATPVVERSFDEFVHAHQTQIAQLSTTALEVECGGCRAQITFQPPDVAGLCPFCATALVAQPQTTSPVITPEGIIPATIARKAAQDNIRRWLSTRWFAPNGLKKMAQQEGIQGIYLPFWTYDCQTESYYSGQRGDYYYTTETYTITNADGRPETRTRQVRHTRWYPAHGTVRRFFDDILIPAVQSVTTQRLEQLEPWDLSRLVPYDASYLSGFKAQRYQINLKQGFDLAKEKTVGPIRGDVQRDIGGDEQRIHSISTTYNAVTFKHLLLPVWISAYRFQNKQYQVMVNAQTGEVLGDRPYSVWKIAAATVSAITAIALALFGADIYQTRVPIEVDRDEPPPQTTPAPTYPNGTSSPVPTLPVPGLHPDAAYHQAIGMAGQAAVLTQTAQTRDQWNQVANRWGQAIELLKRVPPDHASYSMAQQKIQEYQRNLNYAREQAAKQLQQ